MTKLGKMQAKAAQKANKKVLRKKVKSPLMRRLQKERPRRFMNPFLCYAHEQRVKAKNGHLLSDWKAAHKGLGSKWRALGAGRAKFVRHGKIPAFAIFVKECHKECPYYKELLTVWRNAHKGLGAKWRALDESKARYVEASKKMSSAYEQQMKVYRNRKLDLVRQLRASKYARKILKRQKESRSSPKKISKKVKASSKSKSKETGKSKKLAKRAVKKSKKGMKGVARKINARIRMTSINSRALL